MYNHKSGIYLRKINRDDLQFLLDLKNESWWGTHKTKISNLDDQIKWYESMPSDQIFMIAQNSDGLIGVACYTDIDYFSRTLNISGSIASNFRNPEIVRKSFACGLDFAFEILNVQKVNAEVLETHISAQKLEIEYLGFKCEGRKRRSVYKSGRYYDSIILGMLREEWESNQRVLNYKGSCNLNFDHEKAARNIKESDHIIQGHSPIDGV